MAECGFSHEGRGVGAGKAGEGGEPGPGGRASPCEDRDCSGNGPWKRSKKLLLLVAFFPHSLIRKVAFCSFQTRFLTGNRWLRKLGILKVVIHSY